MPTIINKIIKTLIVSDFFLNLGWGLLSPVFALFISRQITSSDEKALEVAGFAALFYWISKSFFEIPIGRFLDRHDGERDDFWFMFWGLIVVSISPIGFLFSTQPWHIYFFQIIHAIGMAMTLPPWLAIFTRHIDKGKEGFEWSVETTSINMGAGIAGGLGGIIAAKFGFNVLFISVSTLTVAAALLFLTVKNNISKKRDASVILSDRPIVEP